MAVSPVNGEIQSEKIHGSHWTFKSDIEATGIISMASATYPLN